MKFFKYLIISGLIAPSAGLLSQQLPSPNILFNTFLTAGEAVPTTQSNGIGMITLLLQPDRTKMNISGLLTNLDGTLLGASLHRGRAGEVGDAVLDLMPFITGRKIEGEALVPAGLLPLLFSDRIYCNIRTSAYPSGELRGQLRSESDLNFSIEFSAGQMLPPVNSTRWGIGSFHFPVGADEILYGLSMPNPDDIITGATIFEGKSNEIGVKVADLVVNPPFRLVFGVKDFDELPADFIDKCIAGAYYLVVKTDKFPLGELRGQVRFMGHLNAIFNLNGINNVPPTNSNGFGMGLATCSENLDSLRLVILLNAIQPSAVQLRRGLPGQVGPLVGNLAPVAGQPGLFSGTFALSNSDLTDVISNRLYVSVATNAFPGGEIRGPVQNNLRKCFAFDLCGSQVVPKNNSTALGMAMLSIDQVDCYRHIRLLVDGLSGVPTSFGIFHAPRGENGALLYDQDVSFPAAEVNDSILTKHGSLFDKFETYLSIGTAAFPAGEIRGQVVRQLSCPLVSGVGDSPDVQVRLLQNPAGEHILMELITERNIAVEWRLQDNTGRIVARQFAQLNADTQLIPIEVSHLPVGVYYLQLYDSPSHQLQGSWKVIVAR